MFSIVSCYSFNEQTSDLSFCTFQNSLSLVSKIQGDLTLRYKVSEIFTRYNFSKDADFITDVNEIDEHRVKKFDIMLVYLSQIYKISVSNSDCCLGTYYHQFHTLNKVFVLPLLPLFNLQIFS